MCVLIVSFSFINIFDSLQYLTIVLLIYLFRLRVIYVY